MLFEAGFPCLGVFGFDGFGILDLFSACIGLRLVFGFAFSICCWFLVVWCLG